MRVKCIGPESCSPTQRETSMSHRRNKHNFRQRPCHEQGPSLSPDASMRAKRRVVSQSLIFKLGIQRIQQQDVVHRMPSILDPLNLDQFLTLKKDDRTSSEDSRSCHRRRIDCEGEREPAADMPDAAVVLSTDGSNRKEELCMYAVATTSPILTIISGSGAGEEFQDCPSILRVAQFLQIKDALPRRFQDAVLRRRFSISQDGDCLGTLMLKIRHAAHTVLVIQTTRGEILGGYCAEPWRLRRRYHGNGISFLFASDPQSSRKDCKRSEDGLSIYPWTGHNDYCQVCDDYLAMGGQGSFGWRVCSELMKGQTGWCRTYENPPLVEGGFFEIANLEVYSVVHDLFSAR